MKILVTGGAGFIGCHITDAYIQHGHNVIIIDNLSTGFERNVNSNATFYKDDICDADRMETILKKESPDVINHHAALASVVESTRNPASTLEVNLIGTVNLLAAGIKTGVKKFIFASTGGALYGHTTNIPTSEKEDTKPHSPYGLSKLLAERTVQFYEEQYGLPYTIFRYANVYGPRQNPRGEAGVVAIFTTAMKEGVQPTLFGDGTKTRDYVYVDDIVKANITALERGDNIIVNLGRGEEVNDQIVFDTIAHAVGYEDKPLYEPVREGEAMRSALDARLARELIGWESTIDFNTGVNKTVTFY